MNFPPDVIKCSHLITNKEKALSLFLFFFELNCFGMVESLPATHTAYWHIVSHIAH